MTHTSDIDDMGYKLCRMRDDRQQSLQDVATICGVSKTHIHCIEHGKNLPSLPLLIKLADHFAVKIAFILGEETDYMVGFEEGSKMTISKTRAALDRLEGIS